MRLEIVLLMIGLVSVLAVVPSFAAVSTVTTGQRFSPAHYVESIKQIHCDHELAKIDYKCDIAFERIDYQAEVFYKTADEFCIKAFNRIDKICSNQDTPLCNTEYAIREQNCQKRINGATKFLNMQYRVQDEICNVDYAEHDRKCPTKKVAPIKSGVRTVPGIVKVAAQQPKVNLPLKPTPIFGAKVTIQAIQAKPWKQAIQAKPWKQATQAKPWKQVTQAKPWKQATQAKPWKQATQAKPWKQATQAKPWKQATQAKPWKQATQAKPWKQATQAKPWKQATQAKPWKQATGAKPWKQAKQATMFASFKTAVDKEAAKQKTLFDKLSKSLMETMERVLRENNAAVKTSGSVGQKYHFISKDSKVPADESAKTLALSLVGLIGGMARSGTAKNQGGFAQKPIAFPALAQSSYSAQSSLPARSSLPAQSLLKARSSLSVSRPLPTLARSPLPALAQAPIKLISAGSNQGKVLSLQHVKPSVALKPVVEPANDFLALTKAEIDAAIDRGLNMDINAPIVPFNFNI